MFVVNSDLAGVCRSIVHLCESARRRFNRASASGIGDFRGRVDAERAIESVASVDVLRKR